jgi:endonuclease-3
MTLSPREIIERLASLYGMPVQTSHGDAVSELVLTILSQNTADTNSGRAFTQLLRRFPGWDAIVEAPVEDVVEAIALGGLAQQKAPRIQSSLRAIAARAEGWNLDFLRDIDLEEARAWLRALPGVGPKTAACVLLFALGRPAMPVDTHVERVSKRLGLIPRSLTSEQAHQALEALVDPSDYYRFHMLLIKHGRRLCAARRPLCERCPLEPDCPSSLLRPADEAADGAGQRSGSTSSSSKSSNSSPSSKSSSSNSSNSP